MPTARCCCNCEYFEDLFDRSDSTDLGGAWTEIDGDWEIAGGELTIAEEGIVRCHAINPVDPSNMVVRAKITNYQDNTRYRLLAQVSADGSDYYYAEWYYVDSSNMYFTIGDSGGAIGASVLVFSALVLAAGFSSVLNSPSTIATLKPK